MNNIKKIFLLIIIGSIFLAVLFLLWKPSVHFLKSKNTEIQLQTVSFSQLPSWGKTNLLPSMTAFQVSCNFFLKAPPEKIVGSDLIHLNARDWRPACEAAAMLKTPHTQKKIKRFFETWFEPVEFYNEKPLTGLFTGYYVPLVKGSLTRTPRFNIPIYAVPNNLITMTPHDFDPTLKKKPLVGRMIDGNRMVPYYSSEEIDQGAIADKAAVIAWVDNRVDRLFLQIEGSGRIELPDGSILNINYAGQNGAPYTAIGSVLIKQGVLTKETVSMQTIRAYLKAHPEQVSPILNANKSFVFFKASEQLDALGAQNVPLTPGYSLAVDQNWIPLGVPIWLTTTRPDAYHEKEHPFKRLMIAQDIGGAIRGPVRGDIFWGAGEKAANIAGKMKQTGIYWMLLPKSGNYTASNAPPIRSG